MAPEEFLSPLFGRLDHIEWNPDPSQATNKPAGPDQHHTL